MSELVQFAGEDKSQLVKFCDHPVQAADTKLLGFAITFVILSQTYLVGNHIYLLQFAAKLHAASTKSEPKVRTSNDIVGAFAAHDGLSDGTLDRLDRWILMHHQAFLVLPSYKRRTIFDSKRAQTLMLT